MLALAACGGSSSDGGRSTQVATQTVPIATATPATPGESLQTPPGWSFLPLTTQKSAAQTEGYSNVIVKYGVINLSSNTEEWADLIQLSLDAQVNCQAESYDNACPIGTGGYFQPPNYAIIYQACFTIPTIATALALAGASNGGNSKRWDIATDVNGSNKLPPEPSQGLLQVGQSFTLPNDVQYTLQSASVQRIAGASLAQVWWQLNVNDELTDSGGTDAIGAYQFQVLDSQGNEYNLYPGDIGTFHETDDPLEDVPPGLTHTGTAQFVLNQELHPTDNIQCDGQPDAGLWPPVVTGLRVVVQLTGSDGEHYAVYSLGAPKVLPTIQCDGGSIG